METVVRQVIIKPPPNSVAHFDFDSHEAKTVIRDIKEAYAFNPVEEAEFKTKEPSAPHFVWVRIVGNRLLYGYHQ